MFHRAESFNQPLFQNVSNVADMSAMFEGATSFNQPLNKWNVSNVWRMESMEKVRIGMTDSTFFYMSRG